jgi:2-methylcitrate dehydratase PrpD
MMGIGITEKIARFAVEKGLKGIPEYACKQAKMGILDWVAVSLAALKEEGGSIKTMLDLVLELGGQPKATIIGSRIRTSPPLASLVNGYIGHVLDYDETCTVVRSHLTAPILPAVLAIGEDSKASGKKVLESYVLGYEIALRIGEVMTPDWIKEGWHGTSIFGIFGATVGCGKLLELNVEQMWNAIGIASSMAGGISRNFGTMTKPLHAGLAAKGGVLASISAKKGFTASKDALEGPLGFYHAYAWAEKPKLECIEKLGEPWGLETPGVMNPKLYPCCHGLAINIEYGIRIQERYRFSVEDIEEIEIHSQPKTLSAMLSTRYVDTGEPMTWDYEGPPRQLIPAIPKTGKEGKFSKEYAFARALLDGKVQIKHFADKAVKDPLVQKLMKKIKVYHNSILERISREYPEVEWAHPERMVIKLKGGRVIEEEETFIQGAAKRPLSVEHVRDKFHECASEVGLSAEKREKILSIIDGLEEVKDISRLITHLEGFV